MEFVFVCIAFSVVLGLLFWDVVTFNKQRRKMLEAKERFYNKATKYVSLRQEFEAVVVDDILEDKTHDVIE